MDRDYLELRVLKRGGFYYHPPAVMSIIRGTDAQTSANFAPVFFTADRDYEVVEVKERHTVAASDGSVDVVKVASGVAAENGTTTLVSALPLTGTANTIQTAQISQVDGNRLLHIDDSLALNATGLLTSLQGVSVIVYLRAV